MSDRAPSRRGRALPLLVVGVALFLLGVLSLLQPALLPLPRFVALWAAGVGAIAAVGAAFLFRIPHEAAAGEIPRSAEEEVASESEAGAPFPQTVAPVEGPPSVAHSPGEVREDLVAPPGGRPAPSLLVGAALGASPSATEASVPPPEAEEIPPGPLAFSAAMAPPAPQAGLVEPFPFASDEERGQVMAEEIARLRERVRELESGRPAPAGAPGAPDVAGASFLSRAGAPSIHRLARVPMPPALFQGAHAVRSPCAGCGALLTDIRRASVCWGCGRPLCTGCFWKSAPEHAVHYCDGCVGRGVPAASRSGASTSAPALGVNGLVPRNGMPPSGASPPGG